MKIALIGYGKMGHMIEDIAKKRGHEIVSIIDVNNINDFDSDAFRSAEVAIEFTNPTAAYDNLQKAWAQGVKVVSGSTGWLAAHETELKAACANEGKTLLWASNFSLGVAIFGAVNKYLAHIMNQFPDYDVTMTETHHVHKLDAPSGTAITLAEQIVEADGSVTGSKENAPEALRIDAIRRDEVPGIHTVEYDSPADCIRITHDAHSRQGFALGAVLAAEYVAKHEGWLTIDDLFNF